MFVIAHLSVMFLKFGLGNDIALGLVPMFDFYEESNAPTYFSSIVLFATALLLYFNSTIVKQTDRLFIGGWRTLTFGFLFLSLDEVANARMLFSNFIKHLTQEDNFADSIPLMAVEWTIPIIVILLALAIYFVPFLLSLKNKYKIHFILAGICYVFAAVVLENIEGHHLDTTGGKRDLLFTFYVTIEETLEIASILYFQYFLMQYIEENNK